MCRQIMFLILMGLICVGVTHGQVSVKINFQSDTQGSQDVPEGYLPDYGYVFGDRGNGWSYGWTVDKVASSRDRDINPDQRYDTNNSLNIWNTGSGSWEIEVPEGHYDVYIVGGDPGYLDQTNSYIVEGVEVLDETPYVNSTVNAGNYFDEYTVSVPVTDGRLTIAPVDGVGYVKICFVHIVDVRVALPVIPEHNSTWSETTIQLEWLAGRDAIEHDVYIGESFDAVDQATPDTSDIYKGRQTETTYPATGEFAVEPGKTYYWRIDEFDGMNIIKGGVFSFIVEVATAYNPNPVDNGFFVDTDVELSWSRGSGATIHRIYFGDDYDSVLNATSDSPEYQTAQIGNNTTWSPPGPLALNQTYYWRVDETSSGTTHKGNVWRFTTASRLEGGLKGEYFENMDLMGDPVLTRIDPQIDYDLGGGSPEPNVVPADGFSVRWSGQVDIPVAGEWTFLTSADDGVRLWIDDELIIDNWVTRILGWDSDSLDLEAGLHSITLEWFDIDIAGHIAIVRLYWESSIIGTRQLIPEKALTPPFAAGRPQPNINAMDVDPAVLLSWVAGDAAAMHDVYFGTSYDEVDTADVNTAGIYQGRQDLDNTTFLPDGSPLQWGQTYYWRIDEINDLHPMSPWKGGVLHFTVGNYVSVDNFEAYTDDRPDRIFETWRDRYPYTDAQGNEVAQGNGTGMTVGVDEAPFGPERTIVNGGTQSLPLTYDNSAEPYYSETDRTFTSPQDWTGSNGHALNTMSLWYRGYPASYGSLAYDVGAGQYTVVGAGNDIWNTADQFHYAYLPLPGDGSITVRVDSIEDVDEWAKAGVMIRETLNPDAVNITLDVTPANRVEFITRLTPGVNSQSVVTDVNAVTLPHWLRLTRTGGVITGEHSIDGVTWEEVQNDSSVSVLFIGDVYIGLAVTSRVNAETSCTGVFSNVTVEGAGGSVFDTSMDIGIPVNSPANLYVGLASGGTPVTIEHPDGDQAVFANDWTQWRIDLSEFSDQGIDLSQITQMVIGTGDKTPDGTGKLFVDDIRLEE